MLVFDSWLLFLFQAEDGIRDLVRSRGLGDVYKRQGLTTVVNYIQIEFRVEDAYAFDNNYSEAIWRRITCLLYTSPSPRDRTRSRMPSSA